MSKKRLILNDMPDEQYALIGRAIRSFSAIEHELGRAIIALLGGPVAIEANPDLDKRAKNILKNMLAGRLSEFVNLLKQARPDLNDWADDFQAKLEDGIKLRNAFVHGTWESTPDNKMRLTFYPRDAFTKNEPPKCWEFSVRQMQEIDSQNLCNLQLLVKNFAPIV
ncbi:hypothetical protein [Paracoccus aerodenitrificans]|uniref:hypothetical protein n=1 Tax=Paracoccus aerodenitrificans TaxID=3017781 RepID=UPI0022F10133|nr:hypothetical protein [Paracoccus aerodenitrificans]WBU63407.1 hypothetical protein PAE61_13730 [Paracoccus aerodenitrificans]